MSAIRVLLYSRASIEQHFDQATFARGLSYFAQDRVGSLRFSQQRDLLSGRVRGSHRKHYRTQVQLSARPPHFHTHCSCPVGRGCKHAVALLLGGLEQAPDAAPLSQDINAWIDDLFARQRPAKSAAQPLHFRLSLPDHPEPHLAVQCYRPQGASRPLSFLTRRGLERLPSGDAAVIQRLRGFVDESPSTARLFNGGSGELLDLLIGSGRCHWLETTTPLRRGERRPASARWVVHDDASQELLLETQPGSQLLPVEPLHYFDSRQGTVGPVDSPLSANVLPLLLRAPRIRADQVAEFANLLDRRGMDGIPRPQRAAVHSLPASLPQARLALMHIDDLVEWPHGFVPDTHVARLQAGYHGHWFDVGHGPGTTLHSHDGRQLQITRNREAEAQLQSRLSGFHPIPVPGSRDGLTVLAPVENARSWQHFLARQRAELEAEGWEIDERDSFGLRLAAVDDWDLRTVSRRDGWFDISAGFRLQGEHHDLLPILQQLLEQQAPGESALPAGGVAVKLGDGQLVTLPSERLQELLDTLGALLRERSGAKPLRVHRLDLVGIGQWQHAWLWQAPQGLSRFAKALAKPTPPPRLPVNFGGSLRAYQQDGLAWLQQLDQHELGGVLADDMGLGKTIQTLAHLAVLREQGPAPTLIVAPTSVLGNWRAESQRFTPHLHSLVWHGPDRDPAALADADLVITSYATLLRDVATLAQTPWRLLVLDEAQTIKNPRAKISQAVKQLQARQRLCLSGTPVENHLGELWSLFDFLAPGFLGDARRFARLYRVPIEKQHDASRAEQLRRRVGPFLLRRLKDEVATELPAKSVMLRSIALAPRQADLYETLRASLQVELQQAIAKRGVGQSQIDILGALLKLRQACCDPRLLRLKGRQRPAPSAKLDALMEMLPELIADGRRVLLFSQFTQMLDLIVAELQSQQIPFLKLTGRSRKRDELVQRFQAGEVPLFLISLKAGGTGLNLTAADTVIHYDPWWNPAVENQATDRAHRIGQNKPVFVYKLICTDTVEERIQAMQERKQQLADQLYAGTESGFSEQDLALLLQPLG